MRADIVRSANTSPSHTDVSPTKTSPEGTVVDAVNRSPRDASSAGDATLVDHRDISNESKHFLDSPTGVAAPVARVVSVVSVSGSHHTSAEPTEGASHPAGSPATGSTPSPAHPRHGGMDVTKTGDEEQREEGSPTSVDVKMSPQYGEKSEERSSAKRGHGKPVHAASPADFGYLYTVSR